jgi:hypothetical protein
MTKCRACEKWIETGQTIVGMPVLRVLGPNKTGLAGTELLMHVRCFLGLFKVLKEVSL